MSVSVPEILTFSYAGNGATTAFSYPVKFLANTDLVVVLQSASGVQTVKTISTHYTVTGAGGPSGGTVTMLTAPATGETLRLYRATARQQIVDLENSSRNDAGAVELQLDRTIMTIQDLATLVDRAWKAAVGSSGKTITAGASGTVAMFDASGNLGEGPSAGEISNAQGYAEDAAASAVDAQNAEDGAEEALAATLAAVPNFFPTTRTALKAANTSTITSAFLKESGREGQFIWTTGNYSTQIAADTAEGVYIKADAIASTAGAWVRVVPGVINPMWFGPTANGTADDYAALFCANAIAVIMGRRILFDRNSFRVNTNLTFTASTAFAGGILKPASGISITLTGAFDALAVQIFDVSLGGSILGQGAIPNDEILPSWFGATQNGSGFQDAFWYGALAFAEQRTRAGATGATVVVEPGKTVLNANFGDTFVINAGGIKIKGRGQKSSYIITVGQTGVTFDFLGDIGGGQAAYGTVLEGFTLQNNTVGGPTGGCMIRMTRVQMLEMHDVGLINMYQGMDFINCGGPHPKRITACTWVPNATGFVAGSFIGRWRGTNDGIGTGLNENWYLRDNVGGGIGTEYGYIIKSFDQFHVTDHLHGCRKAVFQIGTETVAGSGNINKNAYNMFISSACAEAINNPVLADYGIEIMSQGTGLFGSINIEGGQILNGHIASLYVNAPTLFGLRVDGVQFLQSLKDGIYLKQGKHIHINGVTLIDWDCASGGTGSALRIGDTVHGPEGVVITDLSAAHIDTYATAHTPPYGILYVHGKDVMVNGGQMKGATQAFANGGYLYGSSPGPIDLTVNNFDVDTSTLQTVPVSKILPAPIGIERIRVSNASGYDIDQTRAVDVTRNRMMRLYFMNATTINEVAVAGGFKFSGAGTSKSFAAGDILTVRADTEVGRWVEESTYVA